MLQTISNWYQKRPNISSGEEENPFHKQEDYSSGDYRPQRRLPQRRDHVGDVKVDIPEFEGKMNGDVFLDWLYTVDRVFDYKELLDERKVKLVAIKLRGYTSLWWENFKKERDLLGKDRIHSWEKMKKELKKRFLAENYKQGALSIEGI